MYQQAPRSQSMSRLKNLGESWQNIGAKLCFADKPRDRNLGDRIKSRARAYEGQDISIIISPAQQQQQHRKAG